MSETINYTPTKTKEVVTNLRKLGAIDDLYESLERLEIGTGNEQAKQTRWVLGLARKGLIQKQDELLAELIRWILEQDDSLNDREICQTLDELGAPVPYKIRLVSSHRYKHGIQPAERENQSNSGQ